MRMIMLYTLAAFGVIHVDCANQPWPGRRWLLEQQERNLQRFLPQDAQNPWGDMFYCLLGRNLSSNEDYRHDSVLYRHSQNSRPQSLFYSDCGDGFCKCRGETADCSYHDGNLTYVPQLPENITRLLFKYNNLASIPTDDFFSNVSNINILDISDNDIESISPDAFRAFNNLVVLCLRNSRLTYDTLAPVLNTTSLRVLDISNGPSGAPPDGIFHKYPLPRLESLTIMQNSICALNMSVFAPLENLKYLSLEANGISVKSLAPHYLPQLRALDLCENSFYSFFETCQYEKSYLAPRHSVRNRASRMSFEGNRRSGKSSLAAYKGKENLGRTSQGAVTGTRNFNQASESVRGRRKKTKSFFPNLTALALSTNDFAIRSPPHGVCLPKLDFFCLGRTYMLDIYPDMFQAFPSLRVVSLIASSLQLYIHQHAFRHPRLEVVDISYSNIDFSQDVISADMFSGCPALQSVVLSHNDFDKVPEDKFQRLFRQAPNLQAVSLAGSNIGFLSRGMFAGMLQLSEVHLEANRIGDVPDGMFDVLPSLQALSLAFNQIRTIRETTFSAVIRNNLQVLSLSNNAFQCDCDLRWFRNWLVSQPLLFQFINDQPPFYDPFKNKYLCTNLANTTVQSFFVEDQACVWSPAVSKFIIASIVFLLLPLAMATALYRYRWHIRLVIFEAFRGQGDRWRRLQGQHFRYDVFVSYDSQDLGWMRAHLMPELEGRLRLRLCIHQRDFTIGAPIVENIEESVQTSKKVLMVFSRNFARSQWCQFELQLCLRHVMENDDMLLVVLLEDIPSRELTPAMMAVMKTTTYIEWADEEDARHSFWQRLRLALHEILPGV